MKTIAIITPAPCSLYTLGAIDELFSLCNQAKGEESYRLFRLDNDLSKAEWGEHDWDWVIIAADTPPPEPIDAEGRQGLQQLYHNHTSHFILINSAAYWFAEAGLLKHQKITLHWQQWEAFKNRYSDIEVLPLLFCTHERLTSCAGQAATLDCLLERLSLDESEEVINELMDKLCLDRRRSGDEKQRLPGRLFGADIQPRLTMALELMENNLEEPLSTEEIAGLVHISRRQLERLFKQYLDTMPAKHYLSLRLERAKHLLCTTNISIVQVGLMCGFSSGPHFSSSYKAFFDITPREERAVRFSQR